MNVSTQTFIIRFDEERESMNLDSVFDRSTLSVDDVVLVKYMNRCKTVENDGTVTEIKLDDDEKKKNFLNCITLHIKTNVDKIINVKIFHNSVLQLTGCTCVDQVKRGVKIVYRKILSSSSNAFFFIVPSMRNVDFDAGFKIDRLKLAKCLASYSSLSVPPMTSGYMGLKIKMPVSNEDVLDIPITYTSIDDDDDDKIIKMRDLRDTYLYKSKIFVKNRFVSISVFQNGKILISCIDESIQNIYYGRFKSILESKRDEIEQQSSSCEHRVITFGDI